MLDSPPARIPVICGPTAGGKTDLAVALAHALYDRHRIPAEILSADAFLVYRGMNIGTAKPTDEDRRGIPHHLIDVRDPRDSFTVEDWLTLADRTIDELRAKHILPIVVGGTHLYIKALLDGLFEGPEPDPELRAELNAMDPAARRAELQRVDPAAAERIHPNDTRRTVRALEVFRQTGTPISHLQTQWDALPNSTETRQREPSPACTPSPRRDRFQLITLDWDTDALNRRINARVKSMFDRGLIDEVRAIRSTTGFGPQSSQALGYKQVLAMLDHAAAAPTGSRDPSPAELEATLERIKIETRRFAKNQRTWLRRLRTTPGTIALPMPATSTADAVRTIADQLGLPTPS